jgi:hypothetical protein
MDLLRAWPNAPRLRKATETLVPAFNSADTTAVPSARSGCVDPWQIRDAKALFPPDLMRAPDFEDKFKEY